MGQENTSRGKEQKAEYDRQEADICSVKTGERRRKKARWGHRAEWEWGLQGEVATFRTS